MNASPRARTVLPLAPDRQGAGLHEHQNDDLLVCRDIVLEFGAFRAVNSCSFSVRRGSITGLVGPNGAGKSTMINLIAGALHPSSGKIHYAGEDITDLAPNERFHRGLVRTFQIPHEFAHLSVLENLMLVAPHQAGEQMWSNWFSPGRVRIDEDEIRRRAWATLGFLELTHIAHERAGRISGGQKKLLELGRTMMTDAQLVLLDEPAAGVNRTLLRKLESQIEYLNRERNYTFLLIEHDMEMIERLCDPVVCMTEGSVLIEADFKTVRSDPHVLEAYLGETKDAAQ
ncbi:branched-chain amino acid transport system ATP-binding protein [Labrys monachus]|uniref:Branched-chain amino acid transport system ATP-binding protein n=1 Tax=Labrys monachus TaxID=217067 RepID=A0ABU0FFW6_9HYPH|nr:branched-chain amino acid transport system ATP-binding protein [Labrys monachus]